MRKINWQYAIGEIIIVIIGITLAFSLNSWKDNRSDSRLRSEYLQALLDDLTNEGLQLQENDSTMQVRLGQIGAAMNYMRSKQGDPSTAMQNVFGAAQGVIFTPEIATYQTLINSGDLRLINDFSLRRNIEAYYNDHQVIQRGYERIEIIGREYVGDFFIHDIDFEGIRKGNFSFLDNPKLINIFNTLNGSYYIAIQANADCLKANELLAAEVKTMLEK